MEQQRLYYPALDSLRGIAVILVVLYHYFPFFRFGWIGVDLFFVLSGFLITNILLESKNSNHYFRDFYLRRSFRIFPLYYLSLGLFFIFAPYLFTQKGSFSTFDYYTKNQVWFWTFTQNWLIIKKGIPPEPYLQHFWSLAIEEQFYLVWPFLVFFIKQLRLLQAIVVGLFIVSLITRLFIWYNANMNEAFYYNSFCRMDSLSAGAFLSVLVYRREKISNQFIAVIYSLFLMTLAFTTFYLGNADHNSLPFATYGYSVTAVFFMCICYQLISSERQLINTTILKSIGRISYGIYIYHLPILLVGSFTLKKANLNMPFLIALICILATLTVSAVSYKFFELPLLRFRNKFTKPS